MGGQNKLLRAIVLLTKIIITKTLRVITIIVIIIITTLTPIEIIRENLEKEITITRVIIVATNL